MYWYRSSRPEKRDCLKRHGRLMRFIVLDQLVLLHKSAEMIKFLELNCHGSAAVNSVNIVLLVHLIFFA